ncbi:adenylate/guanylate cyclase domain-containing protein [Bradyrhizobium genosp. SA-3]|uniref:adenylate/guanylate cyclase domain-containing protein n=1 Tax=Bradyrhizobium genosp. SA-3 TaxID=508868 RepID=UPI001029D174|nr:adenylate/guanylate cyclase domain-containing protein [Bradyrhizobium genosp. SA-3]RZM94771.1 adenylate/guanylate cyclase domain-containing protein [Bradyrhizobium genosp. SA-3]
MMADPGDAPILHHRLASVLMVDVVGYTRLMELDERSTHGRLMNFRFSILHPIVEGRRGKIVKNTGDGFLAMFDSARDALEAAIAMQSEVTKREADQPPDRRIAFRMGLNIADVIVEDHDIYGDGVNIAARLQSYAEPAGIVVSGAFRDAVGGTLGLDAVDLGLLHLRNLSHPVQVISLTLPGTVTAPVGEMIGGYEGRASIAVLPFRSLTSPDEAYFAHGMVDRIIYALASLKELFVISRGSTAGLSEAIDLRVVGKNLGVRYVLSGSVLRSGQCLRIGTELGDANTGEIIRADQHEGDLHDLFHVQDRIAQEVVKTIAPNVRDRELRKSLRKHPQNTTAYDLVLQAMEPLYELDYATFSRARGLLQRAIALDPGYAPAFSYAAYWHMFRQGQGWSPDVSADINTAARLARAAIANDSHDAMALAIFGHAQSHLTKDFEQSVSIFDSAIAVCPNSAIAWILKGATLCFTGDGPNAVRCAETGVRLSPFDRHVFFAEHILAQAHYVNRNFDQAISWGRRADMHNARNTSNLRTLISSLIAINRLEEASEIANRHAGIVPDFRVSAWAARTPMQGDIKRQRIQRLLAAGMPE